MPTELHDDWNRIADKARFAPAFAGFHWDLLDVPAVIARTERVYEFPLVDKEPLGRWTNGRVTTPWATTIRSTPSLEWQRAGHPRCPLSGRLSAANDEHAPRAARIRSRTATKTAGIVLRNRLNGPEQVMALAEQRAPDGFEDVHDVISASELESISLRYKQLAGFDVQTVSAAEPATRGGR